MVGAVARDRLVLSRELADFIFAFSGAFQKFLMYPQGHPALATAVRNLSRKVDTVFLERNAVAIGVTPNQLIISAVPTDPKHVLLRDLAAHLHRRNIGGVKITAGVRRSELEAALEGMTSERQDTGEGKRALPRWPHVRLYPLSYDHLELMREEEEENSSGGPGGPGEDSWARRLWLSLARAALGDDLSEDVAATMDPPTFAGALERRSDDDEYHERVLSSLMDYAEACRSRGRAEAGGVLQELSKLMNALTPETTERLLRITGDGSRQRGFLLEASQVLSADIVYRLVVSSARASSRDLSPALLQLLNKLSVHAVHSTNGRRAAADDTFRELVRGLIESWEHQQVEQHLPELYGDESNRLPELPDVTSEVWAYAPEPERILLMSLESGILEAGTLRAADWMIAKGEVTGLLELLDNFAEESVAKRLRDRVFHSRTVSMLLSNEPIDLATLALLIPAAGMEAATLLLDALAAADDRKVRARLLDLAARYGNAIGSEVVARIPGAPWYVQRNLLHLLGLLPKLPPEFSMELCLSHPDPRVRHEGLKLLLRDPDTREDAIVHAVRAPDLPSLRLGLVAAAEGCPPPAVGSIISRLAREELGDDLRALAYRAIGPVQDDAVVDTLLAGCLSRRRFLWFRRLAPRTSASLEALTSLAMHWRYHPRAAKILARAGKHRDKLMREAAGAHQRMHRDERDPRLKVIV